MIGADPAALHEKPVPVRLRRVGAQGPGGADTCVVQAGNAAGSRRPRRAGPTAVRTAGRDEPTWLGRQRYPPRSLGRSFAADSWHSAAGWVEAGWWRSSAASGRWPRGPVHGASRRLCRPQRNERSERSCVVFPYALMVSAPESSASARDRGRFGWYTRLNACPHGCVPSGVSSVPLRVGGKRAAFSLVTAS